MGTSVVARVRNVGKGSAASATPEATPAKSAVKVVREGKTGSAVTTTAKAAPVKAAPVKAAPVKAAPVKGTSSAPVKAAGKAAPVKETPVKAAPVKAAGKAAGKAAPVKVQPTKNRTKGFKSYDPATLYENHTTRAVPKDAVAKGWEAGRVDWSEGAYHLAVYSRSGTKPQEIQYPLNTYYRTVSFHHPKDVEGYVNEIVKANTAKVLKDRGIKLSVYRNGTLAGQWEGGNWTMKLQIPVKGTSSAPVKASPVKAAVKSAPVKAAPVKAAGKAAPVKASPVKSAPVKAAPVKAAPVKKTPVK